MLLLLVCSLLLAAAPARAWWQDDWRYRRQIDLDTSAQGAAIQEELRETPVLLRLHSGNFDFSKAKPDGSDLRLVAADDQTMLKYQIDTFDPVDEVGLIWVKVPVIAPGSNQNRLFLYYGNPEAADAQDPAGTFASGQLLVYHLDEAEGPPRDASPRHNHAASFSGGQALPAVIGKGMSLYGGNDRLVVAANPSLEMAQGFTLAAWVRIGQSARDGYLFSRLDHGKGIVIGVDKEQVYARLQAAGGEIRSVGEATLTPGTWHYLVVTAKPAGRLRIYLDGEEKAAADLAGPWPVSASDLVFGAVGQGDHGLAVDLDEIWLSGRPRPAAWVRAMFSSQGLAARLVSYSGEQAGGGSGLMPAYYLRIIAGNISLDGWLIISLLMMLGMLSLMVLVGKGFFLHLNQKDNQAFLQAFKRHGGLYCLDGEYEEFENSPLHRVYRAGCGILTRIFGQRPEPAEQKVLNGKEMKLFKASMEREYIVETKRFNAWLVVMTLAISGGPFLGLLGTVWGVMNTFAAMAEAGEANIMAIAPGVASALATTVFGLIVAIPALFGYNYLASRIKELTADLGLFIDEFVLLVDEHHGEEI